MRYQPKTPRARLFYGASFKLAWLNFILLMIADSYLGGNAVQGYSLKGHYFLYAKVVGYHEVTRQVWNFSYWHTYSVIATGLLFACVAIFLHETNQMVYDK